MTVSPQGSELIEVDGRRRMTLRLGHHSRYLARELENGAILLEPAVILTEDELILHSNPELMAAIESDLQDRGSWTKGPRRTKKD